MKQNLVDKLDLLYNRNEQERAIKSFLSSVVLRTAVYHFHLFIFLFEIKKWHQIYIILVCSHCRNAVGYIFLSLHFTVHSFFFTAIVHSQRL